MFRDQQVAFRLAREICLRWQADNGAAAVPVQQLFPKVAFAAKRFLAEKLDRKGDSQPCDVLLVGEYMQAAIGALLEAIKKGSSTAQSEVAVVPQGAAGRGSTLFVDFHTTKPIYPVTRCHLNAMVADTQKWEQSAAFLLDSHPGVKSCVKNDRLGFYIPYRNRGLPAPIRPGFPRGDGFRTERDCRDQGAGYGQRRSQGQSRAAVGGRREPARDPRQLALPVGH